MTTDGPMFPPALVDSLTFISYACNRGLRPDITPERWATVYPNVPAMEAKLQADLAIGKARAQAEADEAFRGRA